MRSRFRRLSSLIVALVVIFGIVALPFVVRPALQPAVDVAEEPGTASRVPTDRPSAGSNPPLTGETAFLIAAGDIASCDSFGDEQTAALVDQLEGTVAALGDTAYPHGRAADFDECYEPTWGHFKERTRPVPGDHDYDTPGAAGYFDYFGDAAGARGQGYYSYDLGEWHVVALNSNCRDVEGGCGFDSPQVGWLREDLAASHGRCVLAYTFSPRFSSGRHGPDERLGPLVDVLHDARAAVLLSAHDHHYERFEPLDPEGYPDSVRGIRQFVVGTGGRSLRRVTTRTAGSELDSSSSFGVLRLTLAPGEYAWEFIAADEGEFRDSGHAACTPT